MSLSGLGEGVDDEEFEVIDEEEVESAVEVHEEEKSDTQTTIKENIKPKLNQWYVIPQLHHVYILRV